MASSNGCDKRAATMQTLGIILLWAVGSTAIGIGLAYLALPSLGHATSLVLYAAWFVGVIGMFVHLSESKSKTNKDN